MIIYKNVYETKGGAKFCPMNVYENIEEAKKAGKNASKDNGDKYLFTIKIIAEMV